MINIGLALPIPARIVMNFVVPSCVLSIGVLSAAPVESTSGRYFYY